MKSRGPSHLLMRLKRGRLSLLQYGAATAKFFKIQLLPALLPWSKGGEERKVALYEDHGMSFLQGLSHLIPLGASLSLIIVNARGVFFGKVPDSTRTTLQFAAKLLEILTQTSLGIILLSMVRYFMFRKEMLPVGALLAPLSISSIAYCWSIDLWGPLLQRNHDSWKKYALLASIPPMILLAAVVGPAGAVLLIPRQMNATAATWNFVLDDPTSFRLPHVNLSMLNQDTINQTMPQISLLQGVYDCSSVYLYNEENIRGVRCDDLSETSDEQYYSFSVPSRTAAAFISYANSMSSKYPRWTYRSTKYPEPVVHINCTEQFFGAGPELNQTFLDANHFAFDGAPSPSPSLGSLFEAEDINLTSAKPMRTARSFWLQDTVQPRPQHSLFLAQFMWSPDLPTTYGTQPQSPQDPESQGYNFQGRTCVMDAYWYNSTTSSEGSPGTPIVNATPPKKEERLASIDAIPIAPEWAKTLTELFESHKPTYVNDINVALYLAFIVSFGLSDIAAEPTPRQINHDASANAWINLTEHQKTELDAAIASGRVHENDILMTGSDWTDFNQLYFQKVYVNKPGFGYDHDGVTVQLSMAVLTLYGIIAVAYLAVTLVSGRTSGSWDSIGELLMLGLNSQRPAFLGPVTAGVESLATYKQYVTVGVNEDGALELVFAADPQNDEKLYKQIEANESY